MEFCPLAGQSLGCEIADVPAANGAGVRCGDVVPVEWGAQPLASALEQRLLARPDAGERASPGVVADREGLGHDVALARMQEGGDLPGALVGDEGLHVDADGGVRERQGHDARRGRGGEPAVMAVGAGAAVGTTAARARLTPVADLLGVDAGAPGQLVPQPATARDELRTGAHRAQPKRTFAFARVEIDRPRIGERHRAATVHADVRRLRHSPHETTVSAVFPGLSARCASLAGVMKFEPDEATWVLSSTDVGLAAVVGEGAFGRGLDYAVGGKVIALATAERGRVLMGTIAGNGLAPYQCLVTHKGEAAGGEPLWVSRCTCPVATECKHAVAAIVAARRAISDGVTKGSVGRAPARATGEGNVVPLFGAAAPSSAASWRDKLATSLGPPAAKQTQKPHPSPSSDAWRAQLGLQFEVKARPTSLTDSTPVQRIEIKPTKLMRTGRWSRTATWVDVRSAAGIVDAQEHQQEILKRFISAHAPKVGSGQTVFIDELGPGVWSTLREVRDAGVTLMLASTPGEGVTLADPAEVSLGIHRSDVGLVLTADVVGVDLEPEYGTATLIGEPAHGVAVLDRGTLRLVPFHETPHAVLQPLLLGDVIEVPEDEIADFEAEFLPQLRRHASISDAAFSLSVTSEPRLLLVVEPITVGKVRVETFFTYGERRVVSAPVGRGRQFSSEAAVISRAAVLLGRLRLTRAVPGHDLWVKAQVELAGMEAVKLADALPELRAVEGLDVVMKGDMPAYEEAEEDPVIEVGVTEGGAKTDWLNLQITIDVDGQEVPYPNLIDAIQRGKETMMLPSGTYFRLDSPQLLDIARVLQEAQQLTDKKATELQISRYDVGLWDQLVGLGVVEAQRTAWQRAVEGLTSGGWNPRAVETPASFTATLRPYQLEGYAWLAHLWDAGLGGILADDMGLGKTIQTLAVLERARAAGELDDAPALVVAPTSVLGVWAREAATFAPHLRVRVLAETSKKRGTSVAEEIERDRPHLVVTSYAVARLDADAVHACQWRALVLDEAQMVKNHTSQTFQAIKKIGAPFGLAISGTPLENSVMDVWSLFNLVAPGLFPRPEDFIRRYRGPIEQGEGHVATDALAALRRRIGPLMLRRRKAEVAPDLPEKQIQRVDVAMSAVHQRVYTLHLRREQQRVMGLLKDPDANRVEILAALTRLRRLALDPALVDDEFAGRQVSRKVETVVQQLVDIAGEGHRALVFSQFTDFLSIVREAAADAGVSTAYLDGSTRNRQHVVDEFRNGDAEAFFISLKAGGTGLTLTEADYVIVLDPWWNPAAEDQAIDRAHRIGQTRHVMVYRYVSAGTIEEKVMELQERKRKLFQDVVDAGSGGGRLTVDDIAGLLD